MTFQYRYGIYNPGQFPEAAQSQLDAMTADGWQVRTASPNFSELYILWEREIPLAAAPEEVPDKPAPHKHRAAQKHRENPEPEDPEEQTSGGLRAHQGQGAR